MTAASLQGKGGICSSRNVEHFVWRLPIRKSTDRRLLSDENPIEYLTIKDLKLAAYVAHLNIFSPLVALLDNISPKMENTVAESWARRSSVSSATFVSLLLIESAWICKQTQIHTSVARIARVDNQ